MLERPESKRSVIALPPSGLMGGYLRAVKKSHGLILALLDKPQNILERIVFFDIDSNPIHRDLTAVEKRECLKEIKEDITYFGKTYSRAHSRIDIAGLGVEGAARRVKEVAEMLAAPA